MTVEKRVDYDQANDRRWDLQNVTRDGACLGLATQWVINTHKGRSLLDWLGPSERASPQSAKGQKNPSVGKDFNDVTRVMKQQSKNYEASHKVGSSSKPTIASWARRKTIGNVHGVDTIPATPILFRQASSWGLLSRDMLKREGFSLVGFWLPGFAHAIASYFSRAGDYVLFFEPNWGEFSMRPGEFIEWLPPTAIREYQYHSIDTYFVVYCAA